MFSGQIPTRPASVGHEISRSASSGGGAPPCPERVAVWLPVVPPFCPISHGSQMVKMTQLGSTSLENLSRVLEFKMVFWGLGFYLASKVMFI